MSRNIKVRGEATRKWTNNELGGGNRPGASNIMYVYMLCRERETQDLVITQKKLADCLHILTVLTYSRQQRGRKRKKVVCRNFPRK